MFFKFSKRYYLFFLFVLIFGLLVYTYLSKSQKECKRLNCLQMKNLEKFKVKDVYQDDRAVYRALLFEGNDFLRVEVRSNMQENEAGKYIDAEIVRMKALFQNTASPYPGEISDEIVCGEEFKPVFKTTQQNNIRIFYFTGFLNERLTFGACTKDQAVYKGVLARFYCSKQKQLFTLELITSNEDKNKDFLQTLFSVGCK